MSTSSRLTALLKNSDSITYDPSSKFIIMSDCHRGDGELADNFSRNQNLYFAALTYYYDNNFTYIELGDGDDLWENRNMKQIINMHGDAFWLLSKFYKKNRFYMLYGNHDMVKENPKFVANNYTTYYDESSKKTVALFPNIKVHESLTLKNSNTGHSIFLIHGHQGDFVNYYLWKCSRFLVRYLWRPLELIGVMDPTRAAKNNTKKTAIEEKLSKWSKENNQMIIAGHTHRPIFPPLGSPLYFNDGSCVHPRCITGIEIENNKISLIKWTVRTMHNRSLFVDRIVLEGPISIAEFYKNRTSVSVK